MNWWQFLLVMMLVLPVMVLWLGCTMDIITRPDFSGLAKAAWMLFIIVLLLFGALAYVITRGRHDFRIPARRARTGLPRGAVRSAGRAAEDRRLSGPA